MKPQPSKKPATVTSKGAPARNSSEGNVLFAKENNTKDVWQTSFKSHF